MGKIDEKPELEKKVAEVKQKVKQHSVHLTIKNRGGNSKKI